MKIIADPMPMLRVQAIARVNEQFNRKFMERAGIDHAHGRKRQIAAAVMAGEPIADDHPFIVEAKRRGMETLDFAQMIANKPCSISAREGVRQETIAAIEAAATPAELEAITSKIG